MAALLRLAQVTRRFPGIVALDAVDFDLQAGQVHALVGENGAGKSTLINLVSGVLQPDSGQLLLDDRPVRLADPVSARRHGVITVHQEAELFGPLSVAENMALTHGLPTDRFGRVRWRQVHRDAETALASLRESIDVRRRAAALSVAHRHMAQLAIAIATIETAPNAKVLILDEPTSALTALESQWLFERIDRLRDAGAGIVYISHRQDEIFELADRITVLRDGCRVWTGAKTAIDRAGLVEAMVGRDRPAATSSMSSATNDRCQPSATTSAIPEIGLDVDSQRRTTAAASPAPFLPAESEPTLSVPRLRVRDFTDAAGRFRAIDLDVRAGEIVGIYGLVGAGRSEWAQAIFGLRATNSGTIEIDGEPIRIHGPGDAVDAGIAYVPEDRLHQGLCRGLSIRTNTVLTALKRLTGGPFTHRPTEEAETVRQTERLGVRMRSVAQPVGQLSGGNQQKIVFARWLLTEPRVLILDEPTRGVDVGAKAEIHRLVRRLAEDGCAVLMISSELPEALEHSDRLVVFRLGETAGEFDPKVVTPVEVTGAALPLSLSDESSESGASTGEPPHSKTARRRARSRWSRLAWSETGLAAAIALLALLLVATNDQFLTRENLLNVLANASVWTILAIGSAAVIIAGGIDISIGSLLALSAATGGLLMTGSMTPALAVPLGILASLTVGLAGGLLNATAALVGRIHPIVVTLGTMTIYRGLLITLTGGDAITDIPPGLRLLGSARLFGISGSILVMALTVLIAYGWLGHTRSGRHLYALGSSRSAARLVGIRQGRVWMTAFGVGGFCAGLAGLLELAQTGSMQSALGTGYELRAIAAAVIGGTAIEGGRGSVPGVLLGALLLGLVQNARTLWGISPFHNDLVIGALLLTAILLDRAMRRFDR